MATVAVLALAYSASQGSAEQRLCVSSTGATRVIAATERCRKIETTVVVPDPVQGETIKSSFYTIPGQGGGGYLSLYTADGSSELMLFCFENGTNIGWNAAGSSIKPGDVRTFNSISGEQTQAFNDLYYGGGVMDFAVVPQRPWSGVFVAKYGKSLSRFELTVSTANAAGDCLVTLFSIGLGSTRIVRY
jgi:hypothetical protein